MALPNQGQPTDDFWATNAPPAASGPSWLPPGYTLNADGSVSDANGRVASAAPQPGYHRDPNTGTIVYDGYNTQTGEITPAPTYTPNMGPAATTGPPPVTTPGGPVRSAPPVGLPTSGFGAYPAPYASDPNAPQYSPMPTYKPPTWTGGDYVNPTEGDLLAMPGYQVGLDAGLIARQRGAAAQGTVLSGGTQKALTRYGNDYATTNYQTLRNNTLDAYKQRYAQFTDAAGMDLGARTLNANENQNTFQNRVNTYASGNARTLSEYLTNLTAKRNAELDYWQRLNDLNQTGAAAAGGSR